MFDFFKKKPALIPCEDIVWMSDAEKHKGLLSVLKQYPDLSIYAWFTETQESFQSYLSKNDLSNTVHIAKTGIIAGNRPVVLFLEHYPILSKEQEILQQFSFQKIIFLNALTDRLLKQYNGESIIQLMQKMGAQEGETLSHSMITASIRKAQEKTEQKAGDVMSYYAKSADEWFDKYLQ
jgi:hypothetical protein